MADMSWSSRRKVELRLSYNIRNWLLPIVVLCHGHGSVRFKTLHTAQMPLPTFGSYSNPRIEGATWEMMEENVFMPGDATRECTDEDEVLLVCLIFAFA
jgi:hypothetical protein